MTSLLLARSSSGLPCRNLLTLHSIRTLSLQSIRSLSQQSGRTLSKNLPRDATRTLPLRDATKQSVTKSTSQTPLEINSNVTKNTLVYDYTNQVFFRNMRLFGWAQFAFWMYLMGFTYTTLRDVSPEEEKQMLGLDEESMPWWRKINLGGNMYRNGLAAMCAIFGITVLGITVAYPSRAVKSLYLLKGGKQVRIQTYSTLRSSADFTTSLDSVSCLHARAENKPQIAMKIRGRWLFFMLDKRGRFHQRELFDHVIGLRRKF